MFILFERQRLAWIFIAVPVKKQPHHKLSLGNSTTLVYLCPPTLQILQMPVHTKNRLCRINHRGHVRSKNDAVFDTILSLWCQNCCELSSITRMCKFFFFTLPNERWHQRANRRFDLPVVSKRGRITSPQTILRGHEYSLSSHLSSPCIATTHLSSFLCVAKAEGNQANKWHK